MFFSTDKPKPWCTKCTDDILRYCLSRKMLDDHCCCDSRHGIGNCPQKSIRERKCIYSTEFINCIIDWFGLAVNGFVQSFAFPNESFSTATRTKPNCAQKCLPEVIALNNKRIWMHSFLLDFDRIESSRRVKMLPRILIIDSYDSKKFEKKEENNLLI